MTETRIALKVEYDGSAFAGWQRQTLPGCESVQKSIEQALRLAYGQPIIVHGAGRTDAGVHAVGQVCHFVAPTKLPPHKLPEVLNSRLPAAVRVVAAATTTADFHARISAEGKHYRYMLEQLAPPSAFTGRYSWQLNQTLDIRQMQQAGQLLLGEHDFRQFTVTSASAKNFVRCITRLDISCPAAADSCHPWQALTNPIQIDVEGSGFLHKMVRLIVARLVAVGKGKLRPADMAAFLDGSLCQSIPPAPAAGLMLMQVKYPPGLINIP